MLFLMRESPSPRDIMIRECLNLTGDVMDQLTPKQHWCVVWNLCQMMPRDHRSACRKILQDYEERILVSQGSSHNHQAWPGGYIGHISTIFVRGVRDYFYDSKYRELPFDYADFLLVLFFHDLEKPWKYAKPTKVFKTHQDNHDHVNQIIDEYGVILTSDQKNALQYVHGELDDYTPTRRVAGPLAAFCHHCDNWGARIEFDHPRP